MEYLVQISMTADLTIEASSEAAARKKADVWHERLKNVAPELEDVACDDIFFEDATVESDE